MLNKKFTLLSVFFVMLACSKSSDNPVGGGLPGPGSTTEKVSTDLVSQLRYVYDAPTTADAEHAQIVVRIENNICKSMDYESTKQSASGCRVVKNTLDVPADSCAQFFVLLKQATVTINSNINPDGTATPFEPILGSGSTVLYVDNKDGSTKDYPLQAKFKNNRKPKVVSNEVELNKAFGDLLQLAKVRSANIPSGTCP